MKIRRELLLFLVFSVSSIFTAAGNTGYWRTGIRIPSDKSLSPQAEARLISSRRADPGSILTIGSIFDPVVEGAPGRMRSASFTTDGKGPYLVQLNGEVTASTRQTLERMGVEVLRYIPNRTLLVRSDSDTISKLSHLPSVRWTGPFTALMKVPPSLLRDRFSGPFFLEAMILPGGNAARALKAARGAAPSLILDGILKNKWGSRLRVKVDGKELAAAALAMAADPGVESVNLWSLPELRNDDSIYIIQSDDTADGTNYALSATIWNHGIIGTGQIACVNDSGMDSDMCYFKYTTNGYADSQTPTPPDPGTLDMGKKVIAYAVLPGADPYDASGASFHGTHTSCTVVGDNLANLSTPTTWGHDTGDGMAPQAQLYFQDVGDSAGSLAGLSGSLYTISQQAYNAGAFCQSDSWGAQQTTGPMPYTSDAFNMDLFTWDYQDFIHIVAQGNTDSGDYVGSPGIAKNIITVGATTHGSSGATTTAYFTCEGPTVDGRIKPDTCAPGTSIISAQGDSSHGNGNCSTQSMSGTSMATPTTAGGTTLARQYFTDGFYPTGAKNSSDGFVPSAALLKAVVINGNDDMGTANIPTDIHEGWGRMHLDNTLFFSGGASRTRVIDKWNEMGLATSDQDTFTIQVASGQTFQATLVWSDPPSSTVAATNLINNLDLEVDGPGGTYLGNVLSGGASSTGGSADTVNNVEEVILKTPTAGTYTVKVKGTSVPGNGFTPYSDRQGYALVVRYADCGSAPSSAPTGLTATDNGTTGIDLSWSSVSGATAYYVYRADGNCSTQTSPFTFLTRTTGTTFADTLVQGGYTYAYKVRAVNDCAEGTASSCASDTYSGNCNLLPTFEGLGTVTNNTVTATCDLDLSWNAATSNCPLGSGVSYNIYRGTTPYFTPSASTRIATGVSGTTYTDTSVASLTTYYYLVRAEDSTTANGGPSNGGNEDTNTVINKGTPWGNTSVAGTFSDDGGDTNAKLTLNGHWRVTNEYNHTSGGAYCYHNADDSSTYPAGECAAAVTPPITLQSGSPLLTYWANYNIEWQWDGIVTEISTDGGSNWSDLVPDAGWPGDFSTGGGVTSPINACNYSLTQGCINGPSDNSALTGWTQYTSDLSSYAGQTVLIRWNFSSDGGAEFDGFYLDDVSITNASTPSDCAVSDGFVALDKSLYNCSDTIGITLTDYDLHGNGSQGVTIESSTETTPENLTLTENPADSGTFTGTIATTSSSAVHGDSLLSLSDGDTITATYIDADDGKGGYNVTKTDTATADCSAPVISNVSSDNVTGDSADITWDTDQDADSYVVYDTSTPPSANNSSDAALVASHTIHLSGLTECTTYYFYVRSTDAASNQTTDNNGGSYYSFTTGQVTVPTYASTDVPKTISDNSTVTSTITVTDNKTIQDVNVTLGDIQHTYDGDLDIFLVAPDNTRVELTSDNGGTGENFIDTVFDDEAAASITSGAAPFTGSFQPEGSLATLIGLNAAGTWTLEVTDDASGDTGTLNNWSITFTYPPSSCGPHASYSSHALVADTCPAGGSGDGDGIWDAGEQVQFSVTIDNDGTDTLTGVTATVSSSTTGVTMVDGTASYSNVAAGSTGTSTSPHFTVQLPSNLNCGDTVSFQIDISSNEGSWSDTFTQTVGQIIPGSGTALDEDFSGGIPGTWTVVDGGSGGGAAATWTTANPGGRSFTNPLVDPLAIVDSDAAGTSATQDEQLITPVMDLSSATSVTLEFDQYFKYYSFGGDEYGDVDVKSSNTGGTWTNVFRNHGADSPNPDSQSIDISTEAAGASDVQIRFYYYNGDYDLYWEVDNVLVTYSIPGGCNMNTCVSTAPKPVPDGKWVSGTASTAEKNNSAGTSVDLTWDVSTCTADDYNIYYGNGSDLSSCTPAGSDCDRGTSGSSTWSAPAIPGGEDFIWWVIVGTDGASTESSWGKDSGGTERHAAASGQCGYTTKDTSGTCP